MLHIVLGLAGLTIRVSGPLIPEWRTGTLVGRIQSLSFVILKLCQKSLLGLLGIWTFSSLLVAQKEGLAAVAYFGSYPDFLRRSWWDFFLASECPLRWYMLGLPCIARAGVSNPLVWVRNKDSAGYRGTLHYSQYRCILLFLCAVNSTE